ncbi:unnamed protein product [Owenia fusiformis]|uniref:Uncharacterized protein n=1 Tax=Owenia fusiformis TaxID=6347 RepID=A0A8J1TYQ6_OWEFU|nr:unnamed protein product [Owenia fusiformis]
MMKRRKSKEMEEVDENEMPNKCKYRVEQYFDQTPSKYRVGPNTEETSSKYNMSQQTEEAHSKYRVGQILPTPLFGRSSKTVKRHECNKLDTESLDPHIAESEACQVMISRPTNTTILRGDTFDLNQFLNEHRQKENTCPSSPSRHHHGMLRQIENSLFWIIQTQGINMKVAVAFLLLAVVATLQTSDAWRFRIRTPRLGLRRIIAPICNMYCNTKCTAPGICAPVCHKVCNIGRKRRSVANDEEPFSPDFTKYDLNKDGALTLEEFAEAISSTPAECKDIIEKADKDNNGKVDIDEFIKGPFQFSQEEVRSQKVVRPDTRSQRYSVEDLPHPNSLKQKKGSRSKKQPKRGQCGMDLAGYISRLNQKQSNWYDTDGPSTQSINRHCSVYATNSSTDHDPSAVYDTNISTDYYPPSVYAINSSTGHHSSMNGNADLSQLFNSYPQSYQSHSEHCEDDMKMWYPGTTTGVGKRSWVPSGEREYGVYPRNLEYLQKYSENPRSHTLQDVTPILPHGLQHETPTLYGQTAGYTPLNSRPLSGGKKHYANSAFRPKELFQGQVEHNGAISKQTDLSEGFQYTPRERKRSFHSAGDHSKSSFNVTYEDTRENAATTEGPTQTFDLRIQPFRMNYLTNGASSSLYPYPREADDAPSRITTQQMSPSYP